MRTTAIHLILIFLAIVAVFGRSLAAGLTWDDEDLIVLNPHVAEGQPAGLAWHWTHEHERLYIPVVYTIWWCISAAAGVNPPFFHAANLLVFVGCCWLLYFLLRRLIGNPWAALGGALLFALHPLQVEPVAWATGMKDLSCTFFSLAAILLYLRPRGYPWATLCFIAAMLCKPAAVALPLVVAAIDLLLMDRPLRQVAWKTGLWLVGSAAMGILTLRVQPPMNLPMAPLWARPLLAADALDWYLCKVLWPNPMAIDYGHTPLRVMSWHILGIPWIALAWMIPAALAGGLIYLRRPILTASALIFALALLPVLGLQPFDFQRFSTVTDRYAQFALVGPALAAAWLLSRSRIRGAFWATFSVLLVLAGISLVDAGYWRNDVTLYQHAVAVNPQSLLGHNNLSGALYRAGDRQAAAKEFAAVMRLAPGDPDAYISLANFQLAMARELKQGGDVHGEMQSLRQAVTLFNEGLKLQPDNPIARQHLAEAKSLLGGQ